LIGVPLDAVAEIFCRKESSVLDGVYSMDAVLSFFFSSGSSSEDSSVFSGSSSGTNGFFLENYK